MIRMLTLALFLCATPLGPALAQPEDHDHDHGDHDHKPGDTAAPVGLDADLQAALAAGGSLVTVDVLGMVCDFCATAMHKTFNRRDEVAAVRVDLDAKVLRVVLKQGRTLDDATIEKLVVRAGYKIDRIRRGTTPEGATP